MALVGITGIVLSGNKKIAAVLVHVGADTSNLGYVGPIFKDDTFEYLPMLEEYTRTSGNKKYSELKAKYGKTLADYVLDEDRDEKTHYDPKFDDPKGLYTYGENELEIGRLSKLRTGNIIFFYCSLVPFSISVYGQRDNKKKFKEYQKGKKNKYVIGFFTISGISDVTVKMKQYNVNIKHVRGPRLCKNDVQNNQHFQEAIGNKSFRVVQGDPAHSALLPKAVSLTERWDGKEFKLNKLGREILGKDFEAMRNIRNLTEEQMKKLIKAIVDKNPGLKRKLAKHL